MSKADVITVKSHKDLAKKRSKFDPARELAKEHLTIPTKDLVAKVKIDVDEEGYPDYCIIYRYDENTSAWSIGEMNPEGTVFVEVKPFVLKAIMSRIPLGKILECQNRREDWNDPSSVIIPDTKLWNLVCANKHSIPDWLVEAKNFKQFMDMMEKEWKRRNPQDNFTLNSNLILESKRAPCVPPPYYLPRKSAPEEKDDGFVVPDDKIEVVEPEKEEPEEQIQTRQESSEEEVVEVKKPEQKKNKASPEPEEPPAKRQKTVEQPAATPVPFSELCTTSYTYTPLTKDYKNVKAATEVEPKFASPEQIVKFLQQNEQSKQRIPTLTRLLCLLEAIAFRTEYPEYVDMKLPGLSSIDINLSLSVASTQELPALLQHHIKQVERTIEGISNRIAQETKLFVIFIEAVGKKGILRVLLEMYHANKLKFYWLLYLTYCALGFPDNKRFKEMLREHKLIAEIPSIHKMVKKATKKASKK